MALQQQIENLNRLLCLSEAELDGGSPHLQSLKQQLQSLITTAQQGLLIEVKPEAVVAPSPIIELWRDTYAAYEGAFDSPYARRVMNGICSADARSRMSAFNMAILGDEPLASPDMSLGQG